MTALRFLAVLILLFTVSAVQADDELNVYWRFTSIEKIRATAHKYADRIDGNPETVNALWLKIGGTHIVMTTHPPKEPKPRYTVAWWTWIRTRAEWFGWWLHEYDHVHRDSVLHPGETGP